MYPPATDDPLSFFPCLLKCHGDVSYEADKKLHTFQTVVKPHMVTQHSLQAYSQYTSCEHGVCYGFDMLQTCESPKHPFQIFKTRLPRSPLIIIYDNACCLCVSCLNREPHFFENTQFAVDRFHWCGHIGCSKGYSLDAYNQKWDQFPSK